MQRFPWKVALYAATLMLAFYWGGHHPAAYARFQLVNSGSPYVLDTGTGKFCRPLPPPKPDVFEVEAVRRGTASAVVPECQP